MSSNTIKAFEKHTGRKSPGAQGVTFRDARKPGLGPHDPEQEQIDRLRRYVRANMSGCDAVEDSRTAPTAAKPGLGPSLRADELERELAEHPEADGKNVRREIREQRSQAQRLAADPTGSNQHIRNLPTLPPPPASVEAACLLARARELEDTARMMLERAAELREVASKVR